MRTSRIVVVTYLVFPLLYGCAGQQAVEEVTAEVEPAPAPTFTREEVDAMSTEEKLTVYNEQVDEEKHKLICSKRMVTGSHRRVTECRTIGERKKEKEAADDFLYDVGKHSSSVPR